LSELADLEAPPAENAPRRFGDYDLLEEIAQGGMGIVYRARHVRLHRIVALKMIRAGELAGDEQVRRFLSEAEAAAHLEHPNIVPVYEVGAQAGRHYYTMKLIDGGSLADRLRRQASEQDPRSGGGGGVGAGSSPPSTNRGKAASIWAARLIAAVARAVHFAHQRGILHRDLKPGNILLDPAGSPHVTDFGIAKRVEEESGMTLTGAVMGTPAYMAPEQAAGDSRALTTAADVYGLGAILYELLTGSPPFRAATPMQTLRLVQEQDPPRPASLNRALDRDLETIVLKCLEKEPGRRYPSAEALAADLDCWLAGEPIAARRSGRVERVIKWSRRRPALAGLIVVSIGALCGLLALGLISWRSAERRAQAVNDLGQAQQLIAQKRSEISALEQSAAAQRESMRRERLTTRWKFYLSDVRLAQRAWQGGDPATALRLLAAYESEEFADLRGFEWHLLWRSCRGDSRPLLGAPAGTAAKPVALLAFSQDGRRIVLVPEEDRRATVVDVAGARSIGRIDLQVDHPASIGFGDPRGHSLRVVADNGSTMLFDQLLAASDVPPYFQVGNIPLAPGGRWERTVATLDALVTPVSSVRVAPLIVGGNALNFSHLCVSPDLKMLVCAGIEVAVPSQAKTRPALLPTTDMRITPVIVLWQITAPEAPPVAPRVLRGGRSPVTWIGLGDRGRTIVEIDADRSLHFRSVTSGARRASFPDATSVRPGAAISADGGTLAVKNPRGSISLWDVAAAREIRTVYAGAVDVAQLAFSADGKTLAVGGWDGSLVLVSAAPSSPNPGVYELGNVAAQAVSFDAGGDGSLVAADSAGYLHESTTTASIATTASTAPVATAPWRAGVPRYGTAVVYSPDAARAAVIRSVNAVAIVDSRSGQTLSTVQVLPGPPLVREFSRRGEMLLTSRLGRPSILDVWDCPSGRRLAVLKGHARIVSHAVFFNDGRQVLVAAADRPYDRAELKLWDIPAARGRDVGGAAATAGEISTMTLSDDDERLAIVIAAGAADHRLLLLDARSFEPLLPPVPLPVPPLCAAFSPDGRRLALGYAAGNRATGGVLLVDTQTGEQTALLDVDATQVACVAFDRRARRLAAGTADPVSVFGLGEARAYLWDADADDSHSR
jgi:WD40 repeat protein